MLTKLIIQNFILIEKLELDFKSGLTVLTGETGSGKSIIIDALLLLFGARLSTNVVRSGSTTTNLIAEFDIHDKKLHEWLKENDLLDLDSPANLIVRRVIDSNSKSKIYINSTPVTAQQIKLMSEFLVDIHTQMAAITLLNQTTQRNLLDEYAGVVDKVTLISKVYHKICAIENQLNSIQLNAANALEQKSQLEDSIKELTELNLTTNQWHELESRHKQSANLGLLLEELSAVQNILAMHDSSMLKGIRAINTKMSHIKHLLLKSENISSLLDSIEIDINELNHEINQVLKEIEIEPDELAKLESRIEEIYTLCRKYRIKPEEVTDHLVKLEEKLSNLNEDIDTEALENELLELKNEYTKLAEEISQQRGRSATVLSAAATDKLHNLGISGEFKILLLSSDGLTSYGSENIEFNVAFNKGMALQPLARVASGGELSRTALALYLLLSLNSAPETIIFDEIDVGIGGKIASKVGAMLKHLGKNKQVICITHNAQTASFADNHLAVKKSHEADATKLMIKYFTEEERVEEMARMLGGLEITDTTLNHAREMLEQGR